MTACVVTRGQFGSELIRSLLKARKLKHTRLFTTNGSSSALSLARSLVGIKQLPVALVLDADAHESSKTEEYRRYLEAMLGAAAPRSEWELILVAPEMEAVFFQVPGLLESLGLPPPTPVQEERAKHQPHGVLVDLISKKTRHAPDPWLMRNLSRLPYDKIWQLEPFERLQRFLAQHARAPDAVMPDHR